MKDDPFDVESLRLKPDTEIETRPITPRKIARRREQFVMVPWPWVEKLADVTRGTTYHVALHLLYLHWKGKGEPIKLANGMLKFDGVSRYSKWRALNELEERGLIAVERRRKRSPIVRVHI